MADLENAQLMVACSVHPVIFIAIKSELSKLPDTKEFIEQIDKHYLPDLNIGEYTLNADKVEKGAKLIMRFIECSPDYKLPDIAVPDDEMRDTVWNTMGKIMQSAIVYWNGFSEQHQDFVKALYKITCKIPGPIHQLEDKKHILKLGDFERHFSVDMFYRKKNGETFLIK